MSNSYSPLDDMQLPLWKCLLFIYAPALVLFVLLDGVFIAFVAGPMFKAALGDMLRPSPDIVAGLLAWVAIVGMVFHFALPKSANFQTAFVKGVTVGLGLYSTYELTNMSIITTWSWAIVASDIAWGSFACGITCVVMLLLQGWMGGSRRV
jgi:uncharacterized membrane protein